MSGKRSTDAELDSSKPEKKRKAKQSILEAEGTTEVLLELEADTNIAQWRYKLFAFLQDIMTKDILGIVQAYMYDDAKVHLLGVQRMASSAERVFLVDVVLLLGELLQELGHTVGLERGCRRKDWIRLLVDGAPLGYVRPDGFLAVYVTDDYEAGIREGRMQCGHLDEDDEEVKNKTARIGNIILANPKMMYWSYLTETTLSLGHQEAHAFGWRFQKRFDQLLVTHKLPPNQW